MKKIILFLIISMLLIVNAGTISSLTIQNNECSSLCEKEKPLSDEDPLSNLDYSLIVGDEDNRYTIKFSTLDNNGYYIKFYTVIQTPTSERSFQDLDQYNCDPTHIGWRESHDFVSPKSTDAFSYDGECTLILIIRGYKSNVDPPVWPSEDEERKTIHFDIVMKDQSIVKIKVDNNVKNKEIVNSFLFEKIQFLSPLLKIIKNIIIS